MQILQYLVAFFFALGVLVVVHELGHYLAARACDVKVLRFSFGFGRVLWSRRAGADATEWAICAFPLGGYVKMLDEREAEESIAPSELARAFNRKNVWQRILIVIAGPLANFLLAIAVYWVLFMAGHHELVSVIGPVSQDSPAARAGLQAGDRVTAVNGDVVKSWSDLRWAVMDAALDGRSLQLDVRKEDGTHARRSLSLAGVSIDDRQPDPMQQAGLSLPVPPIPAVIGKVLEGSPAAAAGLQAGDRILAIDAQPVTYFQDFAERIAALPGQSVSLRVQRGSAEMQIGVQVAAQKDSKPLRGRIGVAVQPQPGAADSFIEAVSYGPLAAMSHALDSTWNTTVFSLKVMWRMVRGEVSLRNVSGPLTIASYAGQSAQAGIEPYVSFIALISISLGVLNLLPVPLLDGGHLLYYVAEIIRGKPLSEHLMELGQRFGLVLLAGLMLLAFFNDINRQFSGLG
ncbi:RIP metalloprotease RseP [Uliginosibacterium sediminicola]|uniref:Zinc metalloprotease n=1 Tax=Uliginosibacterium sediminicola TaxID=2024550 RepID=A0ABU9YVT0_9RHOO